MAIHPNPNTLTMEAVEEYLTIAECCVAAKKGDGGMYGYPAALLLFCVVNVIGDSLLAGNEPFRVLKQPHFDCELTDLQTTQLEKWYRNLLAHNGMIAPGTCLSPQAEGDPFDFSENGEPVLIRVKPFCRLVRTAWDRFDKKRIKTTKPEQSPTIVNPVDFSNASLAMPHTASGSNYIPRANGPGTK